MADNLSVVACREFRVNRAFYGLIEIERRILIKIFNIRRSISNLSMVCDTF